MHQIIVYIECDICRKSFPRLTNAASGSTPSYWRRIASDLEYAAQLSGWHCYQDQHRCFDCIMEEMHTQEFVNA